MDKQKIIELLITNFSWPLTILIVLFVFKDKLGRISNLKTKDYEISFDNEIKAIKKDTKTMYKNNNLYESNWTITSTQSLKENMMLLSEKSPLGVVLQAWGIMENIIVECAVSKGFKNINNSSAAMQYLCDNKFLPINYINLFFRLFALKERYSNFENEVVTKERALETSDIILEIAGEMQKYVNETKDKQQSNVE